MKIRYVTIVNFIKLYNFIKFIILVHTFLVVSVAQYTKYII